MVDADLASYFDTIPHDRLMARVEERVSDGRVLDLIRAWLKADILKGLERWTPTTGTPQGAVLSPLLANIYLDPLDRLMAEHGYRMVRYADDFVILTRTRAEADAALALVAAWVAENGLTLHPEKTRVGDCRQPGEGFDFLGYRFEAGRRDVRKKSSPTPQGHHPGEDAAHAGRQPRMRDRRSQPDAAGLVRLLQARPSLHLRRARRDDPAPAARVPAQAGEATGVGHLSGRSSTLAQCLLRECRVVRTTHGLASSETVSMKNPPTGEPYAGKPPVRFGGRGGRKPFPTPIARGEVEDHYQGVLQELFRDARARPCDLQCALEGIAGRRHQPGARLSPSHGADGRGQPADEGQRAAPWSPRRAAMVSIWPAASRMISAAAGSRSPQDRPRRAPAGRNRAAWRCASSARWRAGPEPSPGRDAAQERGPRRAPVVRPQRPPHRLAAEPGAAAFVRYRKAPAAHAVAAPAVHGPADAAGTDDDDAAVLAPMSADAGGMGICGDDSPAELVLAGGVRGRGLGAARWHRPAPGRRRWGR